MEDCKPPSYNPSVFASIFSLEDAHNSVQSNPNFQTFLSEFATLATKSDQHESFGLTIVHRHTDVAPGTRMMDFGRTLQPFPLADDAERLHGCPIRPKSYALIDGTWAPYEYELGIYAKVEHSEIVFFEETKRSIQDLGLENLGLRRYSPSDPEELEVTECPGISLKLPRVLVDTDASDYKTTFWAFPSGTPKLYRCACRNTGSEDLPNHNHIDG